MVQLRKLFDIIKIRSLIRKRNEGTTTSHSSRTTKENHVNDKEKIHKKKEKKTSIIMDGTTTEKKNMMNQMNPNLSKRDVLRISKIQKRIEIHESRKEFRKSNTLRKSIAAIKKEAAATTASDSDSDSNNKAVVENPNLSSRDIRRISRIQKRIKLHESRKEFYKSNTLRKSIATIEQEADANAKKYELIAWADRSFMGL